MALWANPDKKSGLQRAATLDFGGGVNNGITPPHMIADNESPVMANIAPYMLPALTPIYPPVISGAFAGAVLLVGQHGATLEAIANTALGVSAQFEFNGSAWVEKGSGGLTGSFFSCCNFMGQFLYSSAADGMYTYSGASPVLVSSLGSHPTVPLGAFITVNGNRVLTTGETAYPTRLTTCAWRNIEDWSSTGATGFFQGYIETPSGEANTAIASLTTGQVVIFKSTSYHELWNGNDDPSTWQVVDRFYGVGCVAQDSIAEINGWLYWLGLDGIYRWSGGYPERISDQIKNWLPTLNVGTTYNYLCGGSDNRYYYINLSSSQGGAIFAYDTLTSTWWGPWSYYPSGVPYGIIYLTAGTPGMYVGDGGGRIYRIDYPASISSMAWLYETKPYSDGSLAQEKQLVDAYLTAEVWPGASLQVYLSNRERDLNDGLDWTLIGSASAQTLPQTSKIFVSPTALAPSYFYRLKFAGTGRVDIYGIDKNVYVTPKY